MQADIEGHRRDCFEALYGVLKDGTPADRCCAVRGLARLNIDRHEARSHLVRLLGDPDLEVRLEAADAIGRLRVSEATGQLIRLLASDPEGDVRIEAVGALRAIGSAKAAAALIDCLEAEGYPHLDYFADDMEYCASWQVHSRSLSALGEIGDARAIGPVIDLLENQTYEDLQDSGLRALIKLDKTKAEGFLLRLLSHGRRLARRRAIRALSGLVDECGALSPEIETALVEALLDGDSQVRISAAKVLGKRRTMAAVVPLTMMLRDPDGEVRREVASILGELRGPAITDNLHALLQEEDAGLKRRVVEVLGEIGDPASQGPLVDLLDGADSDLLYAAVGALGEIAEPGSEDRLAAILADGAGEAAVRVRAAEALGRILKTAATRKATESDPGQLPGDATGALRAAVFDGNEAVSCAAITALGRVDAQSAEEILVDLLSGAARCERRAPLATPGAGHKAPVENAAGYRVRVEKLAVRVLGQIRPPGPNTVDALIELAGTAAHDLRAEALISLGGVGDELVRPVILEGLEAAAPEVRAAALEAVALRDRPAQVVEQLIRLLDDPDPFIRQRAVELIGRCDDPRAVEGLLGALQDQDRDVCRAAIRAISHEIAGQNLSQRLVDLLFAFSGELRIDAAAALKRLGRFDAADDLRAILDDPERQIIHWICIDALAELFAGEPPKQGGATS